MRVIKFIVCLMLVLPGLALADTRIAIIDQERVLFGSAAAQEVTAQLQQEFQQEEQQLRAIEQDIVSLRNRAETEGSLMTNDELTAIERQVNQLLQERQNIVQALQGVQQERRVQFIQTFEAPLTQILEAIVEDRNIDLLISADEVLYANPNLDITDEALNQFNAWYAQQ
jgi:outer membrane protein